MCNFSGHIHRKIYVLYIEYIYFSEENSALSEENVQKYMCSRSQVLFYLIYIYSISFRNDYTDMHAGEVCRYNVHSVRGHHGADGNKINFIIHDAGGCWRV